MKELIIKDQSALEKPSKTITACRAMIVINGQILVTCESNNDLYKFIGGGVEENESIDECILRECMEESGYKVKIVDHFLTIKEYFEDKEYITNYYVVEKLSKHTPSLTNSEVTRGLVIEKMDPLKLLEIFETTSSLEESKKKHIYAREYEALKEYFYNTRKGKEILHRNITHYLLDNDVLDDVEEFSPMKAVSKKTDLIEVSSNYFYEPLPSKPRSKPSLNDFKLDKFEEEESFNDALLRIIDEKKMTDVEVYKNARVSKQTFSKLRSFNSYHPHKDTAIQLCLGLHLSERETEELLDKAGYTLSYSLRKDLIIRYFIRNKMFNVYEINNVLDEFNCKTFSLN